MGAEAAADEAAAGTGEDDRNRHSDLKGENQISKGMCMIIIVTEMRINT